MGVILQEMAMNYRIETVGAVCVPTAVPDHAICRKLHRCGTSLFRQRVVSWDPTGHRYITTFVAVRANPVISSGAGRNERINVLTLGAGSLCVGAVCCS